jgi:hypothetical protein
VTHARRQQAAERIMEDAGLTGDLTDDLARPLIEWATRQADRIAADAARSDAEVDAAIGALRRALLQVTQAATADHTAGQLVALAHHTLIEFAPDLEDVAVDLPDTNCTLSTAALTERGPTRRALWQQRRRRKPGTFTCRWPRRR